MNIKLNISLLSVIAYTMTSVGCAPVHRGVVAMKISDTEAHVCLNKNEISVGENVKIFRNICQPNYKGSCNKKLIGNGKVTELLNDHYSVVAFPSGLNFKEGDIVEK